MNDHTDPGPSQPHVVWGPNSPVQSAQVPTGNANSAASVSAGQITGQANQHTVISPTTQPPQNVPAQTVAVPTAASNPTAPVTAPAAPPQAQVVVEIRNLYKNFGNFQAVSNLSMNILQGEVFGLLGPNGSGKTTTINMISGLSNPSSGEVIITGIHINRRPRQVRKILGCVPQETALYEELSAWKNMDFHADLFSIPRREKTARITQLLEMVQLFDHKDSVVRTFSGGMKRRLAIARALLHDPKLIYLDEPTIGVDVQARRVIWDYILALRNQGKTILVTTNYLEEAEELCDRLAIIDHGQLITLEKTARLKELYGGNIIDIDTIHPDLAMSALQYLKDNITVESNGNRLKITTKDQNELVAIIINIVTRQGGIRRISTRSLDLDEIFLKLTGKALRD